MIFFCNSNSYPYYTFYPSYSSSHISTYHLMRPQLKWPVITFWDNTSITKMNCRDRKVLHQILLCPIKLSGFATTKIRVHFLQIRTNMGVFYKSAAFFNFQLYRIINVQICIIVLFTFLFVYAALQVGVVVKIWFLLSIRQNKGKSSFGWLKLLMKLLQMEQL